MEIFLELSILLLIVTLISLLMKILKQPFVVGYILAGILVGPSMLDLFTSSQDVRYLSQIGITILLFIVGLGLNPRIFQEIGKTSFMLGMGQVFFTSVLAYLLSRFIGISHLHAIYLSAALTFSSTIIVLKILTDKGDTDSLYGKISVGLLLVQDLVASFVLLMVTSLTAARADNFLFTIGIFILKAVIFTGILLLFRRFILLKLLDYIATKQELLFVFSLTWGMLLASVFHMLGFSIEIGSLMAGITLSSTAYAQEIAARMKPLRDFFLLLFFVLLGSQMSFGSLPFIFVPAVVLSIFVIIVKPLVVFILLNLLGYRRVTGFMAGATTAQISEFSLILIGLGVSVGHLPAYVLSLVTLVGLISIASSSYLMQFSSHVYRYIGKSLRLLEIRRIAKEHHISIDKPAEIILFGYDRVGSDFVQAIKQLDKHFVIVDYNPQSIHRLKSENLPFAFGDADDVEFLDELGIEHAKLIISTIPDEETNKLLVSYLHQHNPKAISIVTSHHLADTLELYKLGASYVVMPIYLGAQYAAHMISRHGLDHASFSQEKERHINHLTHRRESYSS